MVKDSVTYLDILKKQYYQLNIIYPTFVRLIRNLLGEVHYVEGIFYIQSIIAILSSVYVTEWFRKQFTLSYRVSIIIYELSFLPYAYSLPEHVLSHEFMTEGLAMPVFNPFNPRSREIISGPWYNFTGAQVINKFSLYLHSIKGVEEVK